MESINQIKDDILTIRYKGKKVTINISKELAIDESTINTQLRNLPSNYAFLCLLRDKAIQKANKLEKEKNYFEFTNDLVKLIFENLFFLLVIMYL